MKGKISELIEIIEIMFKPGLKNIWSLVGVAVLILTLVSGIFLAYRHIDDRVDSIVYSDEFISELGSKVRPFVIVNSNNSILLDSGGLEYIEKVTVLSGTDNTRAPIIIVTPKNYMVHPPILTCMFLVHTLDSVERGNELDWVYTGVVKSKRTHS